MVILNVIQGISVKMQRLENLPKKTKSRIPYSINMVVKG